MHRDRAPRDYGAILPPELVAAFHRPTGTAGTEKTENGKEE